VCQPLTFTQKLDKSINACHALRIKPRRGIAKTKHFSDRIQQRGIPDGDRLVLGRKQIRIRLNELDQERKELIRAMDKGGVIVVECGGALITAYDFDSFKSY
jgi:hypothetical protein